MALYQKSDAELLSGEVDRLIDDVNKSIAESQGVSDLLATAQKAEKMVLGFISKRKRKIYGGYALNRVIEHKNRTDAFYDEHTMPDIDFYSPKPIPDLIEVSNMLADAGFKVRAAEAFHHGTYKIYLNDQELVDITYVPANIFHRMPFIEIGGINYIHPNFMIIDYLRMITDPMSSYFRIEKSFNRLMLMQKHYPLKTIQEPIRPVRRDNKAVRAEVIDFLKNRHSCYLVGYEAYNIYVDEAKSNRKYVSLIESPEIEFVSTEYSTDGRELIDRLKKSHGDKITVVEYYPFFEYLDYRAVIMYGEQPAAVIIHHGRRCSPVRKVGFRRYENGKRIDGEGQLQLANFPRNILYLQTMMIRARANKEDKLMRMYTTMVSHLGEIRRDYFQRVGKNLMHDTLFQEFSAHCIGSWISPKDERQERINKKKQQKKGPWTFKYDPYEHRLTPDKIHVQFANTSGNLVRNDKNLHFREGQEHQEDSDEVSVDQHTQKRMNELDFDLEE